MPAIICFVLEAAAFFHELDTVLHGLLSCHQTLGDTPPRWCTVFDSGGRVNCSIVPATRGLLPPVQLLRWHIGRGYGPLMGSNEPEGDESAMAWFTLVFEAEA